MNVILPAVTSLSLACYGGAATVAVTEPRWEAWRWHVPEWFIAGPMPASELELDPAAHYIVVYQTPKAGRVRLYFGPCDRNGDGLLNTQDFFEFSNAWSDHNRDGVVNSQDFFDFVRDWTIYSGRV